MLVWSQPLRLYGDARRGDLQGSQFTSLKIPCLARLANPDIAEGQLWCPNVCCYPCFTHLDVYFFFNKLSFACVCIYIYIFWKAILVFWAEGVWTRRLFSKMRVNFFSCLQRKIPLITYWQAIFKKLAAHIQSLERNNIYVLGVHKVCDKEGKMCFKSTVSGM